MNFDFFFFLKSENRKSDGISWLKVPGVVKKARGKVIINIYVQQTFIK